MAVQSGERGAGRFVPLGLLAIAWLVVALDYRLTAVRTNHMNLPLEVAIAGLLMTIGAGAAAWHVAPDHRRPRTGAIAGAAMLALYVVGYLLIAWGIRDPQGAVGGANGANGANGGETWFSLLIEAWFWIGIPLLVCGALGVFGWWTANVIHDGGRIDRGDT